MTVPEQLPVTDLERALRESAERYRSLVIATAQIVWTTDPAGHVEDMPDWRAFTGQTLTEVRGWGWLDAVHPAERVQTQELWAAAVANRTIYEAEYRIRRHDGVYRAFSVRGVPVVEPDGSVREWVGACTDITERRATDAALHLSEQRYRTLLETIPQIIWTLQADGTVAYINARWSAFTGATDGTTLGQAWTDFIHADDRERALALHRESFASGEAYSLEVRLREASGGYCWHMVQVVPIHDEDGQIASWIGSATEIDARKRDEDLLHFLDAASTILAGSLDYTTTLAQVAQLAVPQLADGCAVDMLDQGRIERVAVAHIDPAKIALAHAMQQHYPPDLADAVGVPSVLRTGKPELHTTIPDQLLQGEARDAGQLQLWRELGLSSSMIVPLTARGQVLGAISLVATESHRHFTTIDLAHAEELARRAALAVDNARLYQASQRSREQLAFLAESTTRLTDSLDYRRTLAELARLSIESFADYCVIDMVEHDRLVRAETAHRNPRKAALLRESQERYPPQRFNPVPEVMQTGKTQLRTAVEPELLVAIAQDSHHLELLQELAPRSWMIVPLIARGRTLGTLSLVRAETHQVYGPEDVTLAEELVQRAALAVDNARLYQAANAAIREREVLLSVAAHELKTPLTAALGYGQLLAKRLQAGTIVADRDQRNIQIIVEQSQRLNKMLDLLLDVSRLESGRFTIERAPIELDVLVQRSVNELQATLQRHIVMYTAPSSPLVVLGDELRLEQVVRNLLSNAVKYSPLGGPISVLVRSDHEHAIIAISDSGIGIPADALPQLFQRFFRAANTVTQSIGGLGVGLYVVSEIVKLHGGRIEVTSREGSGSTFTVKLPLP